MNELLSGKCREDFYKWAIDRENPKTNDYDYNVCVSGHLKFYTSYFLKLPIAMQFGVIQDFADDKGIDLDVKIGVDISTQIKDGFDYSAFNFSGWASNIKEARERAIERFNILYNERL